MYEVAQGLAVMALLGAIFAAQTSKTKRGERKVFSLLLPYLFAAVSAALVVIIRPDEPFVTLLLFPFVGLVHLLSAINENFGGR